MTASPARESDSETRRRRALFRAGHRGIREMDLIMGGFAKEAVFGFDEAELAEFERLLELQDADLLKWVTGEADIPADVDTPLLRRMAQFRP